MTESSSWLENFVRATRHLQTLTKNAQSPAVKIAILDTGCDKNDDFFNGPGMDHLHKLEDTERWHDCLGESDEPVDEDPTSHGTAIAALLLRLAPEAIVYIIRIARNTDELSQSVTNIIDVSFTAELCCKLLLTIPAKAIDFATKQGVDILSMSFGFKEEIQVVEKALTKAECGMLFFAAANNDGLNGREMFPAHHRSVISVRGTVYSGSFEQQYDPSTWRHKSGLHYGTLAVNVPCFWPDPDRRPKSGCSIATPIMVAIAAAIITFVDRDDALQEQKVSIRTQEGMLSIFRRMTEDQKPANDRRYLAPWQLYENGDPHTLISYALSRLPPRQV